MIAKLIGEDVLDPGEARADEQGEGGLGTVGGGAKSVEAEDGDAGYGTDVLGALLGSGERLTYHNVEQRHRSPRRSASYPLPTCRLG